LFPFFSYLEKIQQIIRDNNRVRDLDEELLIAKEVSVRLHNELEKSEESRIITEKLNLSLKQHLDTLKESLDQKLLTVNKINSIDFLVFLFLLIFRIRMMIIIHGNYLFIYMNHYFVNIFLWKN
jgi:hypothetical protein